MAIVSAAHTDWNGDLASGSGTTALGSGVASFAVNWKARADGAESTTTPEELLAAAHASCYCMALSHGLAQAGTPPESLSTDVKVTFQPGTGITGIEIAVVGSVPGLDEAGFQEAAADAKANCPVSQALKAVEITLTSATLA